MVTSNLYESTWHIHIPRVFARLTEFVEFRGQVTRETRINRKVDTRKTRAAEGTGEYRGSRAEFLPLGHNRAVPRATYENVTEEGTRKKKQARREALS